MLASALLFLLGVFAATLCALLLVPLVWRKAQRLAWREAEATLPMSLPEMRAEVDKVRAEAAMAIRKAEIRAAQAQESAAQARAEAGRQAVRLSWPADAGATGGAPAATLPGAQARKPEDTLEALRTDPPAAPDALEALNARLQAMDDDSGENRLVLAAALMRIEQLELELVAARRAGPAAARPAPSWKSDAALLEAYGRQGGLRADISGLADLPDIEARRAAIRERLNEIAVAVADISLAAAAEGSPLRQLAEAARADAPGADAPYTDVAVPQGRLATRLAGGLNARAS